MIRDIRQRPPRVPDIKIPDSAAHAPAIVCHSPAPVKRSDNYGSLSLGPRDSRKYAGIGKLILIQRRRQIARHKSRPVVPVPRRIVMEDKPPPFDSPRPARMYRTRLSKFNEDLRRRARRRHLREISPINQTPSVRAQTPPLFPGKSRQRLRLKERDSSTSHNLEIHAHPRLLRFFPSTQRERSGYVTK